ncbi:hypothetical protein, partial [Synechococcus sp. W60.2]
GLLKARSVPLSGRSRVVYAWSLFFTISASDRLLGEDPAVGRYITLALFSAILTGILNVLLAL